MSRELLLRGLDGAHLQAGERQAVLDYLGRLESAARVVETLGGAGASRSQTIRRLVVDGDLDVPTGTVRIGPVAASKGNILLASGGIKLRTNTTTKIDLQSDGDVLIGENTAAPATTNIAIFTTAQTYNSESMGAGDVLIGDNSSGKANMFWDKSAGLWYFRAGTTGNVYISSTGAITIANAANAINFLDTTGVVKAWIDYASSNDLLISNTKPGRQVKISVTTTGGTGNEFLLREDPGLAERIQCFVPPGPQGAKFTVGDGSALADTVIQTAGSSGGSTFATFPGAVNVGTGSSTTAGELTVSGDIVMATGKFIGLSSSAGRIVFTDASTDTVIVTSADFKASLDARVLQGLYVGSDTDPSDNDITYDGVLKSAKNSTTYTGYIFVPLATPLTSTSWDGDAYSDVGTSTEITNSVFGWPANVKAVLMQIITQDSAAWGTDGLYFACGPSATYWFALASRPKGGDVDDEITGVVPCDSNASVWYQISASGASTLDVNIRIWGYWI